MLIQVNINNLMKHYKNSNRRIKNHRKIGEELLSSQVKREVAVRVEA
tara:strand:- start:2819 stop:2959 length:141 start_codon:yes stop_codon:yes gene_type:complete